MAIRIIRNDKDEILRMHSKEVENIDNKIRELSLDMVDTMYKNDGIGLAAVQVGVLKRVVVYSLEDDIHVLINPVITKTIGTQTEEEGCLSSIDTFGKVERPLETHVTAYDLNGNKIKIKAKGLESVVLCHEIDHLDGILFLDKAYDIYHLTEEDKEKRRKELEEEELKARKSKSKSSRKSKNGKRGSKECKKKI